MSKWSVFKWYFELPFCSDCELHFFILGNRSTSFTAVQWWIEFCVKIYKWNSLYYWTDGCIYKSAIVSCMLQLLACEFGFSGNPGWVHSKTLPSRWTDKRKIGRISSRTQKNKPGYALSQVCHEWFLNKLRWFKIHFYYEKRISFWTAGEEVVGVDDIVDPPDSVWLSVNPDEDPTEAFSSLDVRLVAWASLNRHIPFNKKPISRGKITHIEIKSALNWEVRTSNILSKLPFWVFAKAEMFLFVGKLNQIANIVRRNVIWIERFRGKFKAESSVPRDSPKSRNSRTVLAGRSTFDQRKCRFWLFELTWIHIIENR